MGALGPGFYLNGRVKRRQAAVSAELPDALDLLSVSVEAGLGFDGAVQKLTEHMDGPLIEEFELALGWDPHRRGPERSAQEDGRAQLVAGDGQLRAGDHPG